MNSRVRMSLSRALPYASCGALFVAAGGLLAGEFGPSVVSIGAFAAGLVSILCAVSRCREANCPSCGSGVAVESAYSSCRACRRYAVVEEGRLAVLPMDHVANRPAFALAVEGARDPLPSLCCECGEPATRTRLLSLLLPGSAGGSILRAGVPGGAVSESAAFSIRVPFCKRHDQGAILVADRAGGGVLLVQAYAFYLAAAGVHRPPGP